MEIILEQLKKPLVTAAIGLVIGVMFGWFFLGWYAVPVEWYDATPGDLRSDLQDDYLRAVIEAYSKNQDSTLAIQRYEALEDDAINVLARVETNPGTVSQTDIASFAILVAGDITLTEAVPTEPSSAEVPTESSIIIPTSESGTVAATPTTTDEPAATGKVSGVFTLVLGGLCILTVVAAGVGAYFFIIRKRKISVPSFGNVLSQQSSGRQETAHREVSHGEVDYQGQEAPVAQFMTTFMTGDDLYDDSFSIDSPAGEFLGECGVGISETIGVGDPKKVTAFEVWLFDKNDIQTITKVLMSSHAFNDPNISGRLESKGEPVLAEPGKRILLETATLQLEARVVDMNYGQGALPSGSFFDRLTLELAIWPKQGQS